MKNSPDIINYFVQFTVGFRSIITSNKTNF